MKKYTLLLTVLLTVFVSLNSCSSVPVKEHNDTENSNPSEDVFAPVNDSHNYTVVTYEDEITSPDGTVLAKYDYSYPVFESNGGDDEEYIEAVNKMFSASALGIENEAKNEYESLVKAYEESKEYGFSFMPYQYTYDFEIHTDAKGILSVTEIRHYYTGGAHGGTFKDSHTFDVVNGKELSLSDLLYGTEDEIVETFAKEFAKKSDLFYPGDDPLEVVPEEFQYAEYYVDAEGVTAYFQEYHVGPYVVGFVSATVSDKNMLKYDFSATE